MFFDVQSETTQNNPGTEFRETWNGSSKSIYYQSPTKTIIILQKTSLQANNHDTLINIRFLQFRGTNNGHAIFTTEFIERRNETLCHLQASEDCYSHREPRINESSAL